MKVGIIGCGYWGTKIIRHFEMNPNCRLEMCCDSNGQALEKIKRGYPRIQLTTSSEELLSHPEISAVAIVTPVYTHYELAKRALLAGKHVFVEKPLTHSSSSTQELIQIAEAHKLTLMVGHTFLYSPSVLKIKELIDQGQLGDIHYVHMSRINLGIHQPDVSVLWDLAPHDFSILFYLLGTEPHCVSATAKDCIRKGVYDVAFIDLKFPNGSIANIHISWLAPTKLRRTIIVGSKQMVVYDDTLSDEKIKIYDESAEIVGPHIHDEYSLIYRVGKIESPPLDHTEPLASEIDHFLNCCKKSEKPKTDGYNALSVIQAIEAAEVSLKLNGKFVEVSNGFKPPNTA